MLYAWLVVASFYASLASGYRLGLQPAPDWIYTDVDPPTRRITPKSVFVAPTFSACGPGYRHDPSLGRCVRIVKINHQAQWDFFLQKLNAMYSPPEPTKNKAPSGPLHLALPLEPVTTSPPPTTPTTSPTTILTTSIPTTPPTSTLPTTMSTLSPTSETTTLSTTTSDQISTLDNFDYGSTTEPTSTPTTPFPVYSTFSTPPTTLYTSSDTEYPETTDYLSTQTSTESTTDSSTETVASSDQHFSLELPVKVKCTTSVQVSDLDSELSNVDCEEVATTTTTGKPVSYVRFPGGVKKKNSYIRFPDRTWQSSPSYWWPHTSWERLPIPSSYQKVQHFPNWYRNPMWARSAPA